MSGDFLHFLLPSADSGLELTFFTLIIGSMLVSLVAAEFFGREQTWQHNWTGGAQQGALDLEHGSISELSHALASLPERIVANMPGLLLIFGLLGTFLGLGMALDKASGVLQGSGDSLNAMSDSLAQLTGMMKDLGSKFKTSTWGIIAFIVLKLWEASRWSADSRRVDWCVRQMKLEMELSRRDQRADNERRDLQSRDTQERVGERLVQTMNQQSALLTDAFAKLMNLQATLASETREQSESLNKRLITLASVSNRLLTSLDQRIETGFGQLDGLKLEQLRHTEQTRQHYAEQARQLANLAALNEKGNLWLDSLDQRAESSAGQLSELKIFNARLIDLAQERDDHLLTQVTEFINQVRESNLSLASLDQRGESVARQLDALLHGTRDITQRLDALNTSSVAQETHLESTLEGIASVHTTLHAATESAGQMLAELNKPVARRTPKHPESTELA
ncbi:hypothetical protein NJC40_23720 [Pseudomonas sp. 21LCFQ02]|uniref:hypothetical protein n=1 Tax=Pseudomonas sp. 21LCFQ02 TaxID=2957505 RepID=UPI00209AB9C7|nr:hypothetical protein [Pseudomonas sp. 21LCFQ02]MCO8170777.1 hypothetical protein [Pseudomonas sp. 21LCFQ02]